ncbi:TolC family protein [Spirobacillus cienkowskii]|uniref:TolC family protein n=1 Tax=Spirobacillus cienkowskii TaxID=495820 RepID=UPI0030CBA7C8
MMNFKKIFIFLLVFHKQLLAQDIQSATLPSAVLTLSESMDIAEKNSTELKQSQQSVDYYQNVHFLNYFNMLPSVMASAKYTWTPQSPSNINMNQLQNANLLNVTVTQPVTGILQSSYKLGQLTSQTEAAKQDFTATKITARVSGAIAFIKAYQDLQNIEIKKFDLDNANQQYQETKTLFESGDENKTKIDLLQMQAKLLNAESDFETAKNHYLNSLANLKNILKIDNKLNIELKEDNFLNIEQQKIPELSFLIEKSLNLRGEIKSLNYNIKAKNDSINQSMFDFFPKLDAFINYQKSFSSSSNSDLSTSNPLSFGLNFNWHIWDGAITVENKMTKVYELNKLKTEMDSKKYAIISSVTESYQNLIAAIQVFPKIKLAANTLEEAFKLSKIKYKTGNLSASELLNVQNSYVSAKLNLAKLRSDIDLSWIKLQGEVGNIPKY